MTTSITVMARTAAVHHLHQLRDCTTASLIAGGMLFITIGMSTRACTVKGDI